MKNLVLKEQHIKLGAKMVPFAGFNMPLEYSGVIKEHIAVRDAAGLFDVSHMGEFWVKGNGALELLQTVTTNDVAKLLPGQAHYSCLPNGKGGIVDDLIVYKYSNDKYFLVVNASNIEKDWNWINQHNKFGAELENASDKTSLLALQGPKAKIILQSLTNFDLNTLSSFTFTTTKVAGAAEVIVSATGYTGAGGYELYCYNDDVERLWMAILKAGEHEGLVPAGLASRDTLRLEMGYCLYGNDIDDTTSPMEAGLGWIVKFAGGKNFIDREKMEILKEEGVKRNLVGFELLERGIPRHGYQIVDKSDNDIGVVTSGTMSPILQKGIGMGYVTAGNNKVGSKIFIKVRNKNLEAVVTKLPFI